MSDNWMTEEWAFVAYRLARVDFILEQIIACTSEWSNSEPLTFKEIELETREREITVGGIRPIPPELLLLFSEGLGHLRAVLDNVIWKLVVDSEGNLDGQQKRQIEFPIFQEEEKFQRWVQQRSGKGIISLSEGSELLTRIRRLQPFSDDKKVIKSVSDELASMTGMRQHVQHPLLLLQAYSNEDKHRQLRFGVVGFVQTDDQTPIFNQDLTFKGVEIGKLIGRYPVDSRVIIECNSSIFVKRPNEYKIDVNPGQELSELARYVRKVAVPLLILGQENVGATPPQIFLGDNGENFAERLGNAGFKDAFERWDSHVKQIYAPDLLDLRKKMMDQLFGKDDLMND